MKKVGLILLAVAATAAGEQPGIRVIGQAQPDCWSIDSIVAGVTAGAKSDREKALALHKFGMAHFIHFNGPIEERNEYITDPLKLLGVYGYALCGNNSDAMTHLYNVAGLRTRTRTLPAHSVAEVWFEDKWNYIDTDMFGYVFLPGNRIASVDELVRDPDLFLRQKNPPDPFYPFDEKKDMADVFRNVKPSHNYHPYANGHMMNLGLRTGESATLYYRPQGRHLLTTIRPPDMGVVYKDYYVMGAIRKGSLAWCDRPPAAYGNGLIEYRPDLRSGAFRLENPQQNGTAVGKGMQQPQIIAAKTGEPASLVLDVTLPWVIVGRQNDLIDFEDYNDGAVVSGRFWRRKAADETSIFVSLDNGRTWKKVWENAGVYLGAVPFQVDLTRHAKGRYSYQVKFEWVDRSGAGQTGLEDLKLKTWVALSPMALPRVVSGKNVFRVTTAPVRTYYHESRWERGGKLAGERFDDPGLLEFDLGPDGTVEEAKFAIAARGQKVRATLSLSEDAGRTWRDLERFESHPEHDHSQMWFNHHLRGRAFDGAAAKVRLAITGGRIEKVIANSVLRQQPRSPSALRVTHAWKEGDTPRRETRSASSYELEAGANVLNEWLKLEAVSR